MQRAPKMLCAMYSLAACFLLACQEEALRHPPPPPPNPIELNWEPSVSPKRDDAVTTGAIVRGTAASEPTSQPSSEPASAPTKKTLTMAMFMKDYIEPEARTAMRDKVASPKLDAYLKLLADMAPDDERFNLDGREWKALALDSIGPENYAGGCKSCHVSYLKPYKKKYRTDTFEIELQ
jgi:hypothetical protein